MAGYDFTVQPAQIESPIARYGKLMQLRQGQQDADARKIELQQRQMQLDEAKKAQKFKDTQEAVATSSYGPKTTNMGNMQLPGGYGSIPMGSVQGPSQLDRGAYTQGLQKAGYGYEAMQADQNFQKQDADAAMSQVELRKKLADVTTVDLANHSKALELTAQLAQPVDALEQQHASPEVLQKAYNDSLVAGARAGMDVSQLPKVYQPGMARQYMQQAVKAKDIFDNEITMRGQDMTAKTAKAGQDVTKRGQDLVNNREKENQGSQVMQVPQPDGTIKLVRVKVGDAVPPGAQTTAAAQKSKEDATVDEKKKADLVTNARENLAALRDIITRRPELFGPVAGRITSLRAAAGTDDEDISKLAGIKDRFGMVNQGLHSMRSASHVAEAGDAVLNKMRNSPEATLSAINEAEKSLDTFQLPVAQQRGNLGGGGGGDIEFVRDASGKLVRKPNAQAR